MTLSAPLRHLGGNNEQVTDSFPSTLAAEIGAPQSPLLQNDGHPHLNKYRNPFAEVREAPLPSCPDSAPWVGLAAWRSPSGST